MYVSEVFPKWGIIAALFGVGGCWREQTYSAPQRKILSAPIFPFPMGTDCCDDRCFSRINTSSILLNAMKELIAESSIIFCSPDGNEVVTSVQVGQPHQEDDLRWA